MKKEIPPAAIVAVIIVVVALIGFFGYKAIVPPGKITMSAEAIKGMKAHTMGQGGAAQESGARMPGPGGMSADHSR
jgi:hypothetical protein